MPFKRRFKDKYAGSSPENASVVRTLFNLFYVQTNLVDHPPEILHGFLPRSLGGDVLRKRLSRSNLALIPRKSLDEGGVDVVVIRFFVQQFDAVVVEGKNVLEPILGSMLRADGA